MAKGISIRAFAKLSSVSDTAVHKAIRSGRLAKLAGGTIDPALAGTGWHARGGAKGTARPPATNGGEWAGATYADVVRQKTVWTAELLRLEYE